MHQPIYFYNLLTYMYNKLVFCDLDHELSGIEHGTIVCYPGSL